MKRRLSIVLVVAAAFVIAPTLSAYLIFGGQAKWRQQPVRYFVTNRDVSGVTAPQLEAALGNAFAAWSGATTASISAQFVGFTGADAGATDGVNVIGFLNRPDLDRTLGQTSFHFDSVTGQLIEADIFLNSNFAWSIAGNGETGKFDVQSVATHEVGHMLGLGHSALGETTLLANGGRRVLGKNAVMFPIAFPASSINDRTLKPDDVAGISGVYPTATFAQRLGAVTGRVTQGGAGVFGAHVTAFNPTTGVIVGGFALDAKGTFVINGLEPGLYLVRAEPLDDADTDSFFDDDTVVNIGFKPTYYAKLVAVPSGGAGASIEIKVAAK